MYKKKMMEELSWTEFKERIKEADTALIPMGSVEMEGPHLPLAVDSIVALEVARRVSDRVDGTMVAPLVNVTYSDWHMGFPGTMTLSMQTLIQVLKEMCQSLLDQGFKRLFFINSHVGNDPAIWVTGNDLARSGEARVGQISLWPLSTEIAKQLPDMEEKVFLHAGEIMTSVIMAIRPDLVDMDKAVSEHLTSKVDSLTPLSSSKFKFRDKVFSAFHMSKELTQSGAMGDPSAASREKGEKIVNGWVDYIAGVVTEFRKLGVGDTCFSGGDNDYAYQK